MHLLRFLSASLLLFAPAIGQTAMFWRHGNLTPMQRVLLARHPKVARERVETVGRGWEEPAGADSDKNRRVEVQWFTLE